jgi:hypothetical protein
MIDHHKDKVSKWFFPRRSALLIRMAHARKPIEHIRTNRHYSDRTCRGLSQVLRGHGGLDGVLRMVACICEPHRVSRSVHVFLHLMVALLFGITGIVMLVKPVISAEAVTLLTSIFFLLGGLSLYQLISALWTHFPGWGWHALNGSIPAIMGGCFWRNGRFRDFG